VLVTCLNQGVHEVIVGWVVVRFGSDVRAAGLDVVAVPTFLLSLAQDRPRSALIWARLNLAVCHSSTVRGIRWHHSMLGGW
jgi:hypothetical protein